MDLSRARYTTTIDLRFLSALRGTLSNVSQRWLSRTILFGLVILIWAYAIRLYFPNVDKATASNEQPERSAAFIQKPFTATALAHKVRQALDG